MPQTAALLDLHGVGQRASSYRFELLDNEDRTIGDLQPVTSETVVITHDTSRAIVRDLAGFDLAPADAASVNPFSDRVRPIIVLENGYEHPLGVFLFADASTPMHSYGDRLAATLVDKGLILNQAIDQTVGVSPGVDVRSVAVALLDDVGVPSVVDSGGPLSAGAPMVWPAGTVRWQVLTDLATNVGWFPPWFDHHGVCRLQQIVDPEAAAADVTHHHNVYADSMVGTRDLVNAVNRTVAISSDSANQAFVGVYDVPAGAPHSFYARGFHIVEVFNVQGIGSQSQINAAARTLALSTGPHRTVDTFVDRLSFQGGPDPRHDGYTVVAIAERRWLEQSWSLTMTPVGPMVHMLRSSTDCGCEA